MKRTLHVLLASTAVVVAAVAVPGIGGAPEQAASAATAGWTQLQSGPEPDSNPLKGFIPFNANYSSSYGQFPYTMEWDYFPVNAVMTGSNTFDWTAVDNAVNSAAARGHQTAMRFYLDYPTLDSGIPKFLTDGGLKTYPYTDYGNSKSVIPDYNDPNLLSAMDRFIAAFGSRYNGKPQIGFVQVGLIGFWGEWHTYPYNGTTKPQNYMPTDTNQKRILNDFVSAFPNTQIEVRLPNANNATLPMGYHDDSFALETKPIAADWHFMNAVNDNNVQNKWQTYSVGGELRPELQSCIFSGNGNGSACPTIEQDGDNDFAGSVQQTHVSWLMNQYAFGTGYSSADKPAALTAAKSMGYSFRATEALVPTSIPTGSSPSVGITVSNIGIAPFYYQWPVTLALVNSSGTVTKQVTTSWHVSDIASGSSKQFTGTLDVSGVAKGSYTLVAQVTNPMSGGAPIRFANSGQDTTKAGWLTLGSTTIADAGTPATAASYEAEASSSTLTGTAATASCSACSGSAKVGYVGKGATLTLRNITGGVSSFKLYYLSAVSRTATIQINGGATSTITFPTTADWNTVGSVTVNATIPSGSSNTITIGNASDWAPDIDRVTVGQ